MPTIYAVIECRCGLMREGTFSDVKQAEIEADRHENIEGFRRAYKHDANVVNVKEIE